MWGTSFGGSVQVTGQPPHRILNGDMQIVERIGLRNMNAAPDLGFHPKESNLELADLLAFSFHDVSRGKLRFETVITSINWGP